MVFDRRAIFSKASAWLTLLGLLATLISVPVAEAGNGTNFGKVWVGTSFGILDCFCLHGSPTDPTITVDSLSLSGLGKSSYSITNDTCTGVTIPPGSACPTTLEQCQSWPLNNLCTFHVNVAPLHPGPLPAATLTESLSLSNGQHASPQFALKTIGGIIVTPTNSTVDTPTKYALSTPQNDSDPGSKSITFTAASLQAGDSITWKTTTAYQTIKKKSVPTIIDTFPGSPNQAIARSFTAKGGQITVTATAEGYTDTAIVYLVGPPSGVPANLITSKLTSLYQSVNSMPSPSNPSCTTASQSFPTAAGDNTKTPDLMIKIANEESEYEQFAPQTLYGINDLWPNGPSKAIGLMQVPTTMARAWDWVQNVQDGVQIPSEYSFQCKLGTANNRARKMAAGRQGMDLTACQLEEFATDLNGPKPGNYYIRKPGTSQWAINSVNNTCGVCDVMATRKQGGTSTCQPPTGISADPPTDSAFITKCCNQCYHLVNMTTLNCP